MTVWFLVRRRVVALIFAIAGASALAQNPGTGDYPYARPDSFGFDSVNPGNLNVHFAIPVVNKQGRGLPFQYTLEFDGLVWSPTSASGANAWTPDESFGLHGYLLNDGYKGFLSYSDIPHKCFDDPNNPGYYEWLSVQSNFAYHDEYGALHPFNYSYSVCTGSATGDGSTSDGSGFAYDGSNVRSQSGHILFLPQYVNGAVSTSNGTIKDSNGNEVTNNQNGTFTDTMGYSELSVSGSGTVGSPRVFTIYTPASSGSTVQIKISYTTMSVSTAFNCSGVSEFAQQVDLPTTVTLPDLSTYQFGYDGAGRMTSVTLPSGGTISYGYSGVNCSDGSPMQLTRYTSIGNDGSTVYYRSNVSSSGGHTEITGPHLDQTEIDFVNGAGVPYETTRAVYSGHASGGTLLGWTDTCYNGYAPPNCTSQPMALPVSSVSIYRTVGSLENGSVTSYNSNGLVTDVKEYDYGSGWPGSKLRETTYDYAILAQYFTDKIATVKQFDGSGTQYSETDYFYDGSQPQPTSVPQHVGVSGPRGNLTSVESWINSSNALWTVYQVDDTGQLLTASDSNPGNTTYGYDSATDTLLTGITLPAPNGVSLGATFTNDPYTGLQTGDHDLNNQPTGNSYDNLWRPTETDYPDGGKTITTYTPVQGGNPMQTSVHVYQNSSNYADAETQYDSLGRPVRMKVANAPGGNSWYQVDTCINQTALTSFTSYRYQGSGWGGAATCSGSGGDLITYDPMGRVKQVTHGDGSTITYAYSGPATQVTENNVSRITQVDGIGRVTAVCEISSNSLPGSGQPAPCGLALPGTGYLTTYAYDLSNHKVTVTQGAQTRVFQTDWLGRPVSVTEPESGTTTYSYVYNSTGLQVTRVRPQANQTNPNVPTTTWTQYDALGRPVSIGYSDGTPSKSYAYDVAQQWGTTLQNPKGRLVAESTSSTTGAIYGYDAMGRVTLRNECTPSTCGSSSFQTSYYYDEAGNLLWSTDGFGIVNNYTYSLANEVQSITSSLNDSNDHPNIVSNVQNGPSGPLSWQLGNGLCAARQYDAMGRITGGSVRQGASLPSCTGGTQVYGFSSISWAGPYLSSACDSALNNTCSSYQYDEFGRLSTANITQGSGASFSYVYDRWGNRTGQNVTAGSGPQPQFSFNTGNNQITNSGYSYDAAGNLRTDGSSHTYSYDADGNLTQVDSGSTAMNTYDAENQRVRTDNNGTVAYEFIFNPFGQRSSLYYATGGYQIQGQTYWGSTPVEFYNNGYAHYQHQDWLGTERMATNNSGQVEGTYSSLAFGDGFSVSGTDDDPYHFAGLDYDSNSGYSGTAHAQFRQYANDAGRWMSPDPYGGSYDLSNPQSLNRYAYVGNNPLSATDISGLMECDSNDCVWGGGAGGWFGGGDGGICFLFWCWGGGGDGGGGSDGPISAPAPQIIVYKDLDPNRTLNDHLGLPAGMQLPTGGILDIFGIGTPGCEFGACGPGGMGATPGNIWVASGGGPITLSPWIFFILGLAHAPNNGTQPKQPISPVVKLICQQQAKDFQAQYMAKSHLSIVAAFLNGGAGAKTGYGSFINGWASAYGMYEGQRDSAYEIGYEACLAGGFPQPAAQ